MKAVVFVSSDPVSFKHCTLFTGMDKIMYEILFVKQLPFLNKKNQKQSWQLGFWNKIQTHKRLKTLILIGQHRTCCSNIYNQCWSVPIFCVCEEWCGWTTKRGGEIKCYKVSSELLTKDPECLCGISTQRSYTQNMLHKQQQRPESPTVTLTWHMSKYKIHKLHQRYILKSIKQWLNKSINPNKQERKKDIPKMLLGEVWHNRTKTIDQVKKWTSVLFISKLLQWPPILPPYVPEVMHDLVYKQLKLGHEKIQKT